MNYSICQDCGCKTSRLIFCDDCQDRSKRISQNLNALIPAIAEGVKLHPEKVEKVKKAEVNGTITFTKAILGDDYGVKSIEGALKVGRKFVGQGQYFTCKSMKLDGVTMSHTSFKSLFKSGVITEVEL